jgi:hypothetical protein
MPQSYQRERAVTVPVTVAGATFTIINTSHRLLGWSLADAGNPPVTDALDVAVAAAAAGTLTLTGFLTVSLVRVTPAAAWPAGVNQVTLTNVTGGTQTVDIEGGTANAVEFFFPVPLATTGTAVVSVPAIVGGPAYTIEAEGTIAGAAPQSGAATGQLVDGAQVLGVTAPLGGVSDTQWLADKGIYVGTSTALKVITGALSGCIYVLDVDDPT